MKGITQGIPSYLYVLVALVVGIMMLIMVSKYSSVFFDEKASVTIGGDKEKISEALVKIIEKCWVDNRRGLEDKSSICKEVMFKDELKIEEKDLTSYLNCEELPNSNCQTYVDVPDYDCSECSSPYFDDTDKIIWFAEPDNTELKINYFSSTRKIVVVGSPCDDDCICKRDCKQKCIDGLSDSDCVACFGGC